MNSNYVIPTSFVAGTAFTIGLSYILSIVLPLTHRQLALILTGVIFIPALVIMANNYTGSGSDMFGAHDNAGLGVHHAGQTHRSIGNKNSGLLGDVELDFGLVSIGLYGGGLSLLLILILL